jgi:PAS domain S-box-containing protein
MLAVLAWLVFYNTVEMLESGRSEAHAYAVVQNLNQLLLCLKDAESDERAYLITNDQKYLNPYYHDLGKVNQQLIGLERLTLDNRQEQSRLQTIASLIGPKLAELKQTIDLHRTQGLASTQHQVTANIDRALMVDIERSIRGFQSEVDFPLRQERIEEQETLRLRNMLTAIGGGYLLSFLLLTLVFLLLRKEIAKRTLAETRLTIYQEYLEDKIDQRTQELGLADTALRLENQERQEADSALQRSNTRLDLLAETASQLLLSDSQPEIVEEICRKVMLFLDCQVFFNFLADEESGKLHLNAYAGITAAEAKRIEWLDYGGAVCGCVARDGRRIITENIPETPDPRTDLIKGFGVQAYACHPLMVEGKLIGTLSFGTRIRPRFTDEEIAMMKAVTDQVAIAMSRRQTAESLRASEERLRLVLDASMMGTFEVDLLTGNDRWNDVVFALMGLKPGAVPANKDTFFSFVHPDDRGLLQARWDEAIRTGKFDCEFRIIRVDKEVRWLAGKGQVFYAGKSEGDAPAPIPQPIRLLGVNYDITERKQAEERLRDLSRQLSYHVENSPLAVIEWGPDMRLTRWSGEAERIFGWQAEEVLGKRMEDFRWIYTEDEPKVAEVATGLQDGTTPRRFSANRNYRKDGSVADCEWYNSSLLDDSGKLRSILSLVLDVTDRERAEEALRESESRLHTLANAMPQLAWIAQADGHIFWYNQRWYDYTGTTPEQMEGWGWQDVHDPEVLPKVLAEWRNSLATGQPFEMEHPLRGTDGCFRQFLTRSYPLKDGEGRVTQWFGTNTDVTELKQAEERIQASLREKEVLLKEIHHRVKNNLQVISSLVDLQADALDNPDLRVLFEDVRDRVRSMALVHEKLYQSESLARVEFSEYAQTLLDYLWRAHGGSAGTIRLTLDLEPASFSVEKAVPCGLILNELAVNALKHAFKGRTDGEVTVSLHLGPESEVSLGVSDNGVGFASDVDWQQAPSLGLRLVRILAKQLKGTVKMSTNNGTEFRITFSLLQPTTNVRAQKYPQGALS